MATTPIIRSTQSAVVVTGLGREDLATGVVLTLSDAEPSNTGASYSWQLENRPPGSSATITNPLTATPSFTPDVTGSYRIRCSVNGEVLFSVVILAVPLPNSLGRMPSYLETNVFPTAYTGGGNTEGWHTAMVQMFRAIDTAIGGGAFPGYGVVGNIAAVAASAAAGVLTTVARADHAHAHGNQAGGSLHADVIAGGASGFMTGAQATSLAGLVAASKYTTVENNGTPVTQRSTLNLSTEFTATDTASKTALALTTNGVAYSKLAQGSALSVLGVAGNSPGNLASITATASGAGVLRESGSTIGFGQATLAAISPGGGNRIITSNVGGTALTDSADFTWDSTNYRILGQGGNYSTGPSVELGTGTGLVAKFGATKLSLHSGGYTFESSTGNIFLANSSAHGSLGLGITSSASFCAATNSIFQLDGTAPTSNPTTGFIQFSSAGNPFWRTSTGGRLRLDVKGANVASGGTLTLGTDGNAFGITGTTTINYITTTNFQAGATVKLLATASFTVAHNTGSVPGSTAAILLSNDANFAMVSGYTLTLTYDGTNWIEVARKPSGSSTLAYTAVTGGTANQIPYFHTDGTLTKSANFTWNPSTFTLTGEGGTSPYLKLEATSTGTQLGFGAQNITINATLARATVNNLAIGGMAVPTSAAGNLLISDGTAPSAEPSGGAALWSSSTTGLGLRGLGFSTLTNSTVASGASITWDAINHAASTLTLSGSTNVTTAGGLNLMDLKAPTITSASPITVSVASTLRIAGPPVAAGSTTITNAYALNVVGTVFMNGNVQVRGAASNFFIGGGTAPASLAAGIVVFGGTPPSAAPVSSAVKWVSSGAWHSMGTDGIDTIL